LYVCLGECFGGTKERLHLIIGVLVASMRSMEDEHTSVSTVPGRSAMVVTSFSSVASVLSKYVNTHKFLISQCSHRVNEFIAALLALYGPHPAFPFTAAPLLIMIIFPFASPRCISTFRNAGSAHWTVWMREKKLTSKRDFQESVVVLPSGDSTGIEAIAPVGPSTPALSTSPSRCPNCSSAEVTASCEVLGSTLRGRSVRR
jgi:hypothetical protein